MQRTAVTRLTSRNAYDSAPRHCQGDPMRRPGRAARVAVLDPEPGESPLEAAGREAREETGWTGLVLWPPQLPDLLAEVRRAGAPAIPVGLGFVPNGTG